MKLLVRASGPLRGKVRVPGDKSIGHRAVLFASLARGRCVVRGLSGGEDNLATLAAMRAMGVGVQVDGNDAVIDGVGLRGLSMPSGVVDCGNSGTTMRLFAGLLSAQRFGTRLVGDASLTRRPMGRVVGPLRARGAHIAGSDRDGRPAPDLEACYPPLSVAPLVEGESLLGIEYDMPVASAQVKSCLLLSGLYAAGPTTLREPVLSRDHTERMLLSLGVPLRTMGSVVHLDPEGIDGVRWDGGWDPFTWEVPGDPSSAAFLLAAALMVPGSELTVEGVGVNPTRTGFFDLLRMLGTPAEVEPKPEAAGGEPRADLHMRHARVRGGLAGGELIVRMIDEVPVLCALATCAKGVVEVRDAAELRVKESDRIATMGAVLRAFGAPCEELEDGMKVEGGAKLRAATVQSHGDHRIAMSAALLGLVAEGETVVEDADCIATSFPTFVPLLRSLGADLEEVP
ncbi:MAG: 3-phosphoshikimate 1-carboxyvinyltransferase [Myxococcales bacterium]|nr:3-phosphoshikimate 1-carboxyvinyltransferase [Myxococcales bacterium]